MLREVSFLKQQKRLWIYSIIIGVGLFTFFVYRYAGSRLWGLTYPWNSFLFDPGDRFMDFFHVNEMVAGFDPYANGSSYPPLALMIAYIFARIIPHTGEGEPFTLRDSSLPGRISLYALYGGCLLIIFIALWRRMLQIFRKDDAAVPKAARPSGFHKFLQKFSRLILIGASALAIALSAPMIYAFDRGNYLIICVLFISLFCLYYGKNDYAAAVFLAIAACLKIYPLALFFVFLRERKWKPLMLGLGAGALFTAVSAAAFKGGMVTNLMSFTRNVMTFGGQGGNSAGANRYSVGLRNIISTTSIALRGYVSDYLHIAKLSLILGAILLAFIILLCIWDRRPYRQILYLSFFMILFPSPAYFYNLAYLVGPILLFLIKDQVESLDWVFLVGLALIMIPKSYYYFLAHFSEGDGWVGIDCLLSPLIMCILLAVAFFELLHVRKLQSGGLEPRDKKDLVGI